MELSDPQALMADLEEAVKEMEAELKRLRQNLQAVTQYQNSVLRVTTQLCTWMDNIEPMARHRIGLKQDYGPVP